MSIATDCFLTVVQLVIRSVAIKCGTIAVHFVGKRQACPQFSCDKSRSKVVLINIVFRKDHDVTQDDVVALDRLFA